MILKQSKAFSLLEMLVALSAFAFLFLFVMQAVKQSHRQANKIKEDLEIKDSIYHIVNLIKGDLFFSTYFLDLNRNLENHFPLQEDSAEGSKAAADDKSQERAEKNVFLDSQIVFNGSSQEMEFVSYTFSKKNQGRQWIRIRYAVESCPEGHSSGSCLIRYESPYWNLFEGQDLEEDNLVVLRDFDSMSFSYSDDYSILDSEWVESWTAETKTLYQSSFLQTFPLPARVQINIKNKNSSVDTWIFPVSASHLRGWNPYSKDFTAFKKWEAPKKTKKQGQKR